MKSDEQIAREHQDAEFREIQLREINDQRQPQRPYSIAQPIYQAGNAGYSPQPAFAPYQVPAEVVAPVAANEREQLQHRLFTLQKLLKWLSIIDFLTIFFFTVGEWWIWGFLILLVFPPVGFFASRRMSRSLSVCYLIWLILELLIRLILLFVTDKVAFAIIDFLIMIFDIWVLVVDIRFFRVLGMFNEDELDDLRNGIVGQGQRQPEFNAQFAPQFAPQLEPQPQPQYSRQDQFSPQPQI